jgi:hypothetical protein
LLGKTVEGESKTRSNLSVTGKTAAPGSTGSAVEVTKHDDSKNDPWGIWNEVRERETKPRKSSRTNLLPCGVVFGLALAAASSSHVPEAVSLPGLEKHT